MRPNNIVFIVILSLTSTFGLKAQKADYVTIKKSIEAKFRIDLDTIKLCEAIIFNGILYDSSTVKVKLSKYGLHEILVTELGDITKVQLLHKNCDFIILLGTGYSQSADDKLRILDSIRSNLNTNVPEVKVHDFLCSKCQQVIVDGEPYGIYDAKKLVNELKIKEIKYIAGYESADPSVYGRNAANGLIEIFLTEKKKKNRKE